MLEILVIYPQQLGKRIMPPKANKSQLYLIQVSHHVVRDRRAHETLQNLLHLVLFQA